MQRTVNKALMARNVLIVGLSIPDAAKVAEVQKSMQLQIDRLTGYINDLMYEWRIRKEITGQTAMTVMRESEWQDALGTTQRRGAPQDGKPLINGAVAP